MGEIEFLRKARDYPQPYESIITQYENALDIGGLGGKPAEKIKDLVKKIYNKEEEEIILMELSSLDKIYQLSEGFFNSNPA